MFDHLCSTNLNLLYVKGRTDLVLRLEIIKKAIAIIILIGSIAFGLKGICWGLALYSVIAVFINTFYTNQLFNYGWIKQIKDYLPFLLSALVMMCFVYVTINLINSSFMQLVVGVVEGVLIYAIISIIFFRDQLNELRSMIIKK